MSARRDRVPGGRHGAVWDLMVAGFVVAAVFVVGLSLGVFERTLDATAVQPAMAEILGLSFLLLGAAAFVAARRVGQARAERTLRDAAEARFQTIVERVPAISYVWDGEVEPGDGPARYISPQIEAMLGYRAEDWLAHPDRWGAALHPDDLPATLATWRRSIEDGAGFEAEYRIRDAGGAWRWVRDEAAPVPGETGSLYQGVILDITERRESEERIRTMLQRLPVVAFTTDYEPATGIVHDRWIAPGIERLVGVADDAWLGEPDPWVARMHPGDLDRVLGAWRGMTATGGTFAEEYRLHHADGSWVWVREETSAVRRDGRLRCDGVFIDISAQRAAESAHTDAEERFRTLVEQLPAVTYIEEPDTGRNLYISPQIEAIYGLPPGAWLDDPHLWESRLHPEDRDRVLAENRDIARDEWTSEYRSIDRDGRTIWLHNAARLVRDADGAPRFWQGLVFDITDRKTAEQHLREAEERYRHLVEEMPVAVYTDAVDELSTAVYISPRYEDLTGYTPQERLDDPALWAAILHPEDRDRVLAESERTNETGDAFDVEYRVVRKDGRIAWLHDHASLVRGPDGVPIWQGVLQDVTAQRTAADALARRDAILEATGFAAARFLEAESWLAVLDEVLERLGTAAGAARAYVYATTAVDEDVEVAPLRSWGTELRDAPGFGMRAAGLGRWIEELGAGRPVHGPVPGFPEAERAIFDRSPDEVGSILVVPITVDGAWWGSVGLDDPDPMRTWHDGEIDALATAANALGGAIAREQAARRYQALIEQIPAVTYIEDAASGQETYVSPQITAMLGYTPDEWRAEDMWMHAVHPDDRDWVLAEDARVSAAGEVFRAEYRLLTKDGQTRWVREEAVPVADDRTGAIALWQGVRFDITQEKEAEERLRAAEERYRLVVEQLPAIAYVDERRDVAGSRTWPCVYVSPQVETILG
ncbi:MAG TPA: PAS domain-containing protein, partial [Actinomycetota bacterium]|nr:PAS domain-containing protein [Actinomycetota bacterium]